MDKFMKVLVGTFLFSLILGFVLFIGSMIVAGIGAAVFEILKLFA